MSADGRTVAWIESDGALRVRLPGGTTRLLAEDTSPPIAVAPNGSRVAFVSLASGAALQVLRIGDYFIVGLPSEVFVEYQIEIRERSGADFTFVSELANDSSSYVPTPKAYEEGGYEVRSSSLAPQAGQALVDAAIELVHRLK